MDAKTDAQMAYNEAARAKNQTEGTKVDLEALLKRIRAFLIGNDTASSDDVEQVCIHLLVVI